MYGNTKLTTMSRVPTQTGNLEKWEGIFQSGKSQGILIRLEKFMENHTKYWKFREFSDKYYFLLILNEPCIIC